MSVRAYRVIKVERAASPTFNMWHDDKLRDFMEGENHIYEYLNMDNCGFADISVESLKDALSKASELELEDYTIEAIKSDIAWAAEQGDEYITYDFL